jgi:hypothetical protein
MLPHALRVSERTGLDPRLVIAQAAQETGWGKSAPNNNFFGIKAPGDSGATMATNEVVNGQTVRINDNFRTYGGMGQSADDYASFLSDNPRYRTMLESPDLESQLAALGKSGYATDPNYANSVGAIANSIQIPGMGAPASPTSPPQIPMDQLYSALANPWVTPEQRSVITSLIGQNTENADPMRALELQKAQLELAQMQNGGGMPAVDYGMTPIMGVDADGNPVVLQLGSNGTAVATQMPEGVTPDMSLKAYQTALGAGMGKNAAEVGSAAGSLESKLPGLEVVISKLDKLAEEATYTTTGRAMDWVGKELGLPPRDAALARAEYIATVDNQVLPMLRDTFGAAFTVKEGETLRATLGDPNASPAEKRLILRSFIEQKKRDAEALRSQAGAGMPERGQTLTYNPATGEFE